MYKRSLNSENLFFSTQISNNNNFGSQTKTKLESALDEAYHNKNFFPFIALIN